MIRVIHPRHPYGIVLFVIAGGSRGAGRFKSHGSVIRGVFLI